MILFCVLRRLVTFYLKCAAYKSTYLLTYLLTYFLTYLLFSIRYEMLWIAAIYDIIPQQQLKMQCGHPL